jgi:tetrahydromethanopterin S-methyltransferase subunit F
MQEQNAKYENIKKGQLKGLAIGVTIAGVIILGIILRLLETIF